MDLQEFRLVICAIELPCKATVPLRLALTINYYTSALFSRTALCLVCLFVSKASVFYLI